MKISKAKIWTKFFFKSFIWLILPLCILGNIKNVINENGNRDRYNNQKVNFDIKEIEEKQLLDLIKVINTEKKGLDQEYYIP